MLASLLQCMVALCVRDCSGYPAAFAGPSPVCLAKLTSVCAPQKWGSNSVKPDPAPVFLAGLRPNLFFLTILKTYLCVFCRLLLFLYGNFLFVFFLYLVLWCVCLLFCSQCISCLLAGQFG
jgi:hypothetical protein